MNCVCCKTHNPTVMHTDSHHIWPVYLGGPAITQTRLDVCQTTHANIHRILREFVATGWRARKPGESKYAFQIATLGYQAWNAAGKPAPHGIGNPEG